MLTSNLQTMHTMHDLLAYEAGNFDRSLHACLPDTAIFWVESVFWSWLGVAMKGTGYGSFCRESVSDIANCHHLAAGYRYLQVVYCLEVGWVAVGSDLQIHSAAPLHLSLPPTLPPFSSVS